MPISTDGPCSGPIGEHVPPVRGSSPLQDAHVNCSRTIGSHQFRLLVLLFLVALGCLCCGRAAADELRLKNGYLLRGRVLSDNGKQVVLQVPEGKMWIRKSRISSILIMDPRQTLIEECERRVRGGNPGSAIPFLRNEYRLSSQRNEILSIYRESLLCQIDSYLDQGKLERAMNLWKEYRTLPGNSVRDSLVREKIYQGQDRLLKFESDIHLALETNQPLEATLKIRRLLEEFPSEQRKWNRSLAENLLEAGRRLHDSGDLKSAAPLLIDAVILAPDLLSRARTAIVHCSTSGQGLTIEHARQLLPQEPAIYLAAAKIAEISGNGTERAVQLDRVRGEVGQEISPVEIRNDLSRRASNELAGALPPPPDLDLQIEHHQDRFWHDWNLPGKPPQQLEVRLHENNDQMQRILGLSSDSARWMVELHYGQTIDETLHLVPDAPFLDQDALPRELFRNALANIVGSSRWLPPWLEEGLCAISRGQLARMRDLQLLQRAHKLGNLPEITDLLDIEVAIEDELYRAACGSLIEWIICDVPPALLPDLLLQLTEEGLEQTLSAVTGADTLHELQQDWIRGKITGR